MDILRKDRETDPMASNPSTPPPPPSRPRTDQVATTLSEDTEFSGTLKFESTLRVEGKFKGDMTSTGTLMVGKSGTVEAEISVGSMIVEGKVSGNVEAQDLVELRSTAQMYGDVTAAKLKIEEGVVFVGKADIQPRSQRQAGSAKPSGDANKGSGGTPAQKKEAG